MADHATPPEWPNKSEYDDVGLARGRATPLNNSSMPSISCCCGSDDCAVLERNCTILDSVERDVFNAARIGKALLERHEAHIADAERLRQSLTDKIERLEADNRELEASNARIIRENRTLLDHLESLNTTVSDSEARIKSLEATLSSSQQTIRRLERETARAESLERQIVYVEQDQADLQALLSSTHEDARYAISRWKRAEKSIVTLQEQLERMEQDARDEKQRHAQLMGRMQMQREVERELNTAAGRLKGAAALKSLTQGEDCKDGTSVVSHFVRDLLQDNANFQHGISELRSMLMSSNDEIQNLREQLMYHQPRLDHDKDGEEAPGPVTLSAELEANRSPREDVVPSRALSPQLHFHRHYHAAKQEVKKTRKKRLGLSPAIFVPPTLSTPPADQDMQWRPASRTQRDPLLAYHRRAMSSDQRSNLSASTVPTSPTSNARNSVFDSSMVGSFPGSPTTSVDPMSPRWRGDRRRISNISSRSLQVPTPFSPGSSFALPQGGAIVEESDGLPDALHLGATSDGAEGPSRRGSRQHRRAYSRDSIISLSGGLDIHTLRNRPSQLALRPQTCAGSRISTVVAHPVLLTADTAGRSGSVRLRDRMGPQPRPQAAPSKAGAGKWSAWLPWLDVASTRGEGKHGRRRQDMKSSDRPPGVNQSGLIPIPGFAEYMAAHRKRTPSKVLPDVVDVEALREGLAE